MLKLTESVTGEPFLCSVDVITIVRPIQQELRDKIGFPSQCYAQIVTSDGAYVLVNETTTVICSKIQEDTMKSTEAEGTVM